VDWRKIVFAEVVSLFASTKSVTVAAYAIPTSAARAFQPRRASGRRIRSVTAAIPDRKLATCQLVSSHALIPAPPIENVNAAARTRSRAPAVETLIRG